jgi:hypothetical protein
VKHGFGRASAASTSHETRYCIEPCRRECDARSPLVALTSANIARAARHGAHNASLHPMHRVGGICVGAGCAEPADVDVVVARAYEVAGEADGRRRT